MISDSCSARLATPQTPVIQTKKSRYLNKAVFRANTVDLQALPELTETDLEKLGVLLGHRKRMLRAIAGFEVPGAPISAILAAGAVKSPHLLELSGVGNPELLKAAAPLKNVRSCNSLSASRHAPDGVAARLNGPCDNARGLPDGQVDPGRRFGGSAPL
jgi:hypothetical protein